MGYNGKLPGKDEIAGLIIDALRQDKKDAVINAEIQAEINQASLDKAKRKIEEINTDVEVDVDTSKAEKKLDNLLGALTEIQKKIKAMSGSSVDFNGLHNATKQYDALKQEIHAVSAEIGINNRAFLESQKIIRETDKALQKLSITEKQVSKSKKSSKKKKGTTASIDTITATYDEQSGAMKDATKTTKEFSDVTKKELDSIEDKVKDVTDAYKSLGDIIDEAKTKILGTDFDNVFSIKTVEGYADALTKVRNKMAEIKDEASDAKQAYEDINNTILAYTGAHLGNKTAFQKAIKDAWGSGDHAMAAKLFDSYKTKFPTGKYDPAKQFGTEWSENFSKSLEEANRNLSFFRTQLKRAAVEYGAYSALVSLQTMEQLLVSGYDRMLIERNAVEKEAVKITNTLADAQERFATNNVVTAQKNLNAAIDEYNAKLAESNRLFAEKSRLEDLESFDNEPWLKDYESPATKIMEVAHQFGEAEAAVNLYKIALKEAVRVYRELGGDMKLPFGDEALLKEIDIPVNAISPIETHKKTINEMDKTTQHIIELLSQLDSIQAQPLQDVVENVIKDGSKIKQEVKDILRSLNLLDSNGKFIGNYTNQGIWNHGVVMNDTHAIVTRNDTVYTERDDSNLYTYELEESTYLDSLIAKMEEAKNKGIGLARILSVIRSNAKNDPGTIYEIQELGAGQPVHLDNELRTLERFEQECAAIVGATDEHFNKLVSDIIALNEMGFKFDFGAGNILYDAEHGFTLIDLALREVGDSASTTTNLMERLFACLSGFYDNDNRMNENYLGFGTKENHRWIVSMESVLQRLQSVFSGLDIGVDLQEVSNRFLNPIQTYYDLIQKIQHDDKASSVNTTSELTKGTKLEKLLKDFNISGSEDEAKIIAKYEQWTKLIADQVRDAHNGIETLVNPELDSVMEELVNMIMSSGTEKRTNEKIYQDFLGYMSKKIIRYTDADIAEFGDDWKSIINRFGKGKYKKLTRDTSAKTIDHSWEEIVGLFSDILQDPESINPQDQLRQVLELLQKARDEAKAPKTMYQKLPDSMFENISADLLSDLTVIETNADKMMRKAAEAAEQERRLAQEAHAAAVAIEGQADAAHKTANALIGMGSVDVSVEELISKDIHEALAQLRSAKDNETTLISLKGVFDGDDLVDQFRNMVEQIAEQASLSVGNINVKDDVAKVRLYNDELKVTVEQTYMLRQATEETEASLELISQTFNQNVKALNENNFDVDGIQQRALAAVEKVRSSLHGLEYDLTDLEIAAKSITSQDDFSKFSNQLKAAQDNIQAIKNSTVSKNSMNPLANMQRDMHNANIEIETMQLKLEKFGDIQGVAEAKNMLEEMKEAAKQYRESTDAQGQQAAYNQYSNLRSSFKAQTEYINAAKSLNDSQQSTQKQTDPIKHQYQEILDLVNKINTANERMIKFQTMDGGSGLLTKQIGDEQLKKLEAVEKLNSAMSELQLSDVLGKDRYALPDDIQSIGTDYSQIAAFINDAGVQASLTTTEIEKLVNALVKAGDIDLSMLSEALNAGNIKERAKKVAYENQYFADKTNVAVDANGNTSLKVEDIQKLGTVGATTKEKLEELAQTIAKNSDGAVALTKSFSMGADGIAKLDFSILNTNTGEIKDFTVALGTATGQVAAFETTVDKSAKNVQAAQNKMSAAQNTLGRMGFGDVALGDVNAPIQVTNILQAIRQLNQAIASGDQNGILKYTKDLDMLVKGLEKSDNQIRKMEGSIQAGTARYEGNIDPKGDIYGQLVTKVRELASTESNATLEIGRFDSATNTLNASLVHANGTVEQFKVSMYGLQGQCASQQTGVTKLTTSWDRFKTTIGHAGKQLMTAFVGYNVFYKAIAEVRKGIGYVKEIDLALTELKKVTDETEESYKKFLNTAAGTAGEIGSTVSDFTEATANFARLGYTMSESAQMAETAIVYRNVADGLDTVEEATDSIISTMKAFGIESNNTMGIIDRFNEVGNNFAITSAGIGEALQRSASALYAGGNTIDESIALVTAANSVIQNPEQVGTALKTLTLRLRGAKVE